MKTDLKAKYKDLLDVLKNEAPFEPHFSIVLGSGLGNFAESVEIIKSINTSDLPGYPESTVQGHSGKIYFARYEGKNLLLFKGRIHYYEGYSLSECLLPVLAAHHLGTKKMLLTNAAGGINHHFMTGDLMLNSSMNSIFIKKELAKLLGVPSIEQKNRFTDFPSHHLNMLVREAASAEGILIKEGVYCYVTGPSYETPAEIQMLAKLGNDAVGMSTVHEAVFASYLGIDVTAISCVTNHAAGISHHKLSHHEVMETADLVQDKFERLVKRLVTLV